MLRRVTPLIFILALLVIGNVAYAAEMNERDAQRLKMLFIDQLSKQSAQIENRGGLITLQGGVEVEKADSYYAVTLPEMNITDPQSGNVTKLGLIAINALPTDIPTQWKMSLTLPARIETVNKDGQVVSALTIGTQRFGGLWDETLGGFSKLAIRYQDIRMLSDAGRVLSIAQAVLSLDATPKDNDLIDYSNKMNVTGIALQNAKAYEKDLLPTYITADLAGINVPFKELKDIIEKLTQSQDNQGAKQLAALQAMMTLPKLLSSSQSQFKINDFKFGNDVYTATANSDLTGTDSSILGLMGNITAEFTNLDKLIRRLKVHQEAMENKQEIGGVISMLESLRAFATTSEEHDRFNIQLGDNSKITVNEKDASTILLGGN